MDVPRPGKRGKSLPTRIGMQREERQGETYHMDRSRDENPVSILRQRLYIIETYERP
ncbi:MAG: hypothetical protein P8Y60_12935 [Calditrichota bacterium]